MTGLTSNRCKFIRMKITSRFHVVLTVLAMVIALLALLPLGFVISVGIDAGWKTVKALIFRPRVGELLINTFWLITVTVPTCVVLGTLLAWLTEKTNLPGRRIWSVLMVAPLAIPAFVQSYAWVTFFPAMNGLFAATFIAVLAYFPFIYMPVAAMLRRFDPSLEDVAASLGASPVKIFFRIILPQLRLPVCGGALLVTLHLLAEYGLFVMIRFDTFTTAIYDQYQSAFNGPMANMLAGVLALCCLMVMVVETAARGKARYARVGSGAARKQLKRKLTPLSGLFALACFTLVVTLALGTPTLALARWLWIGGINNFISAELWSALGQTVTLALQGAMITTAFALPISWLVVRYPARLYRLLEDCSYIASALPGIVIALALVTVTIHYARPVYQTNITLFLAWLLMFAPRALINLRAGVSQAPVELEQVAQSLGTSPAMAVFKITMRLAAPGATTAAALVFLGISTELTATLLLSPIGTRTLAMGFWSLTSEIDYVAAAPYALLMVLISLPLTGVLYIHSQKLMGH